MKKPLTLILLAAVFFQAFQPALAIPPAMNLSVSPPTAFIHVKPGEILTHTIELKNQGVHALEVEMRIAEFNADGTTGKVVIGEESVFNQIAKGNPGFDKPFIINPRENRTINLKLNIANLAAEKEYPLTILFKAKKVSTSLQNQTSPGYVNPNQAGITQVSGIVASNLIIFISQDKFNKGKLIAHEIKAPKLIDSFSSINFTTLAKNIGDNATPVVGKATITHLLTKESKEFLFYPDMVLADNTRQVRGVSTQDAIYDDKQQLDVEKMGGLQTKFSYEAPFLFGPYRLTINLDGKDTHLKIYAFPFSIIGAICLGIVVFIAYKRLNYLFD